MKELIGQLISEGYLKSPSVIEAFYKVRRRDFLSADSSNHELINAPLPIGHGQTNSQPLTVAFMFELLAAKKGQKVLDIGSGSGWTSAMLAQIVGHRGKVYAIERISELKEFGESNAAKYNFSNLKFFCQDGSKGLKKYAPFDRIIVAAAAQEVPWALKEQLRPGGRLVIPTVDGDIRLIQKVSDNECKEKKYPGFVFVPLIES